MADDPLTDRLAQQYEAWPYPAPINDLAPWKDDADPSLNFKMLWPEREPTDDLDILVAGCGTQQAALLAFRNRRSRVFGIDVSETAIQHHTRLKAVHELDNLTLARMPIEAVATLPGTYDLIISTGVLHHTAEPTTALRELARVLRPNGAVLIMLYAKYGRMGVETLQSAFRDLGLTRDAHSLSVVREALRHLPADHSAAAYLERARDWNNDEGLVDTFLNARDRSYAVKECLELVAGAGLRFQGWLDNDLYYPESRIPASDLYAAINALPEFEIWAVMEKLLGVNATHTFIACRPERDATIDFAGDLSTLVPALRYGTAVTESAISRRGVEIPLSARHAAAVSRIDGSTPADRLEDEVFARALVKSLWRLGFVSISVAR